MYLLREHQPKLGARPARRQRSRRYRTGRAPDSPAIGNPVHGAARVPVDGDGPVVLGTGGRRRLRLGGAERHHQRADGQSLRGGGGAGGGRGRASREQCRRACAGAGLRQASDG